MEAIHPPAQGLHRAQVVNLADRRTAKATATMTEAAPLLFSPCEWAQQDFRNIQGGLEALAGMIRSGLLGQEKTVSAILLAYSHHARIAEMAADKTLSRAAKAERRVRWLERKAKAKAKHG